MDNNFFAQGLDKAFQINGNPKDFSNAFEKAFGTKTTDVNPQNALAALRYNETRGEKNPYSFSRSSGSKTQGKALGAYQVTEGELKTYGQKFLGAPVTSEQFLQDPKLQDNYMTAKIQHGQKDLGLTLPQIFATHRGGYTNPDKAMVKYKSYVDSAMSQYNTNNQNI